MNRIFIAALWVALTGAGLSTQAQYNRRIPARNCAVRSDTAHCFSSGASLRVSREVQTLQSLYRLCLGADTLHSHIRPLRVILAIDQTGSMCNNAAHEHNDVNDKRILAAHLFVDSLARQYSESQVGTVRFNGNEALSPRPLSSEDNIEDIHKEINEAACKKPYAYPKRRKALETWIGAAIEAALEQVDRNYQQIAATHARHIIVLTDGQWNDADDLGPARLLNDYREDHPNRPLPIIHAVFVSDSAWHVNHGEPAFPFGVELESIVQATGGVFVDNAQPHNVVERLMEILEAISTVQTESALAFQITNIATGQTGAAALSPLQTGGNDWLAAGRDFPLDTGDNYFRIVRKTSVGMFTDTLHIYRSPAPTAQTTPGYTVECGPDTLGLNITAIPSSLPVGQYANVSVKADPKDVPRFYPGSVTARICTPGAGTETGAAILLHLDGDLRVSGGAGEARGSPHFDPQGVFGQAVNGGAFSLTLPELANDFALSAWVKLSDESVTFFESDRALFGGNGFTFGVANGQLYFVAGADTVFSSGALDQAVWQHVAAVRTGGKLYLYVNGIAETPGAPLSGALSGEVAVGAVEGYAIDEIYATGTVRTSQLGGVSMLDLPSLGTVSWQVDGAPAGGQAHWTLPAPMWQNGEARFAYASNVSAGTIVNLVRTGPDEIVWSKMGEPVTFGVSAAPAVAALYDTSGNGYIDRVDITLSVDSLVLVSELPELDALIAALAITTAAGIRQLRPEAVERIDNHRFRITVRESVEGDLETAWQKATVALTGLPLTTNDMPVVVTDVLDKAGPVVSDAVHYPHLGAAGNDTIVVYFSEAVECATLSGSSPSRAFAYYSYGSGRNDEILVGATWDVACTETLVSSVRIVTAAQGKAIQPDLDSIQAVRDIVDNAGNGPAGNSRKARIRSAGKTQVRTAVSPNPFIPGKTSIHNALSSSTLQYYRTVITGKNGTLIAVTTTRPLKENADDIYGYGDFYDAVGNMVAADVPLRRVDGSHRDYGLFWDGLNGNGRAVGGGAYLCVLRSVDIEGNEVLKRIKVGASLR